MNARERSLRLSVKKWFQSTPAMPVQVFDFVRVMPGRARYVRVGVVRPHGTLAIVFFRHSEGSWNVYPPDTRGPSVQTFRPAV
jgi:hypothetical protein